jgi:hypothetical protein
MRKKIVRFISVIILSVLFLGLLVGGSGSSFWQPYLSAAASNGPQLSIQSNIPANANSTVEVPVQFTSNGNQIASTVFSIDYDETWLVFDDTIPNAITFTLPNDFAGGCTPDLADQDGEIDCFILDPLVPLASLPDSVVLKIILRTKNPPAVLAAKVGFSANSPAASFGDTSGQSVPGTTLDGSVLIGEGVSFFAYLPLLWNNLVSPPTPVPTVTVTPTDTPTVTPTPSVTPEPTCSNIVENSGFEEKTAWETPATVYTAGYSTARPRNGAYSMRTGIVIPQDNVFSYSSARQLLSISGNSQSATLSMWVYPMSGEAKLAQSLPVLMKGDEFGSEAYSSDFQYILLVAQNGTTILRTLDIDLSNSQTWTHMSFDLSDFIGTSNFYLHFGTYNNGVGGISAMYVDDVTLEVCK